MLFIPANFPLSERVPFAAISAPHHPPETTLVKFRFIRTMPARLSPLFGLFHILSAIDFFPSKSPSAAL